MGTRNYSKCQISGANLLHKHNILAHGHSDQATLTIILKYALTLFDFLCSTFTMQQ